MRIKSMESIMRYSLVVVILVLMAGCGADSENNAPPVINSFTVSATEVVTEAEVTLVVSAMDPDGDHLDYMYESTGGTISGAGSSVTWTASRTPGDYTITVDISDGELNIQYPITITVVAPRPPLVFLDGMVLIPAGEFQMGDSFNEGWGSERPVHTVYVDAFYMDICEVTNAQYREFMDATGHREPGWWSDPKLNAPHHPVVGVNWHDAVAYAEWIGKRLPTEAEWEKAARGSLVGKRYPWGDEAPDAGGVYRANYHPGDDRAADGYEYTAPVGSFEANGYGLHDMAGNVWEWCADWYDWDYYSRSPEQNPTGPDSGAFRVLRGGSWNCVPDAPPLYLRVANRFADVPSITHGLVGFRCVRNEEVDY